jgi:hypothetical protein
MADILLGVLALGPLTITLLLKSNAALSFLSLCAGFVVISFAGTDLENLTGQLNFSINSGTLNLALLALPLLLTLLFTKKSYKDKPALIFHAAIALCAGGLLALVGIPLLSESVRANFAGSEPWSQLQHAQGAVIGAGVFLSLATVWLTSGKKHGGLKKHK